jgi:hypothetical protein
MKLYTEFEVKFAMDIARCQPDRTFDDVLEELTPIQLPSDEKIEEMGKDVIIYNDTKRGWFVEGLRFMRDKIQGGNK